MTNVRFQATDLKNRKGLMWLAVFMIFVSGCTSGARITDAIEHQTDSTGENPRQQVVSQIDEIFESPAFAHAHWGALIESLDTGEIWYERNADRVFMPASNEKIPTGAAALVVLGPDFRYLSTLSHTGERVDDTIQGDLVVWSNGDPSHYTRLHEDPLHVFKSWADSLKMMGISRITGNVIGDDDAFDEDPYGEGWPFNQLDAWYSAEVGALQLNENYVDLTIIPPAAEGGVVDIQPNIDSDYFSLSNELTVNASVPAQISVTRAYGSNEIKVSGNVHPGGDPIERSPSIFNTTGFYTTVLKETLERAGIEVDGSALDCDDLEGWKSGSQELEPLVRYESVPFSELLPAMLKPSQNMFAETFTRTLGWRRAGIGSFEKGKEVVEEVLSGWGITPDLYSYADGSGLSRYNFISPRTLVAIHRAMSDGPYASLWFDALPVAGVDGTLSNRMRGTVAEGNVRAKTGTIANTRALSGYVTTADGERLVFSFLVNGHLLSSRDTENITDPVLVKLAGYSDIRRISTE